MTASLSVNTLGHCVRAVYKHTVHVHIQFAGVVVAAGIFSTFFFSLKFRYSKAVKKNMYKNSNINNVSSHCLQEPCRP